MCCEKAEGGKEPEDTVAFLELLSQREEKKQSMIDMTLMVWTWPRRNRLARRARFTTAVPTRCILRDTYCGRWQVIDMFGFDAFDESRLDSKTRILMIWEEERKSDSLRGCVRRMIKCDKSPRRGVCFYAPEARLRLSGKVCRHVLVY